MRCLEKLRKKIVKDFGQSKWERNQSEFLHLQRLSQTSRSQKILIKSHSGNDPIIGYSH